MATVRVEWDHVDASEGSLETWVTVIDGVALYVVKIAEDHYVWRNSFTGNRYRSETATSLIDATIEAVNSLRKDDNNE